MWATDFVLKCVFFINLTALFAGVGSLAVSFQIPDQYDRSGEVSVPTPLVVDGASAIWADFPAVSPSWQEVLITGLRQRGLFDLAEAYCRELLQKESGDLRQKVTFGLHFAWIYAHRAQGAYGSERERLFGEALKVVAGLGDEVRHPLLQVWIRFEEARILLGWSELEHEEAELVGRELSDREDIRTRYRKALERFRSLEPKIEEAIRAVAGKTIARGTEEEIFSSDQLAELLKEVAFQRGRCCLALGRMFSWDSADHAAYVAEARAIFAELARLPGEHRLAWPSRLKEIEALRLERNIEEAYARLRHWQSASPPRREMLGFRAEHLRLLLMQERISEAYELARSSSSEELQNSPELARVCVEVILEAWKRDKMLSVGSEKRRYNEELRRLLALIETHHGARHLRQARALAARHIPELAENNLELCIQAAEHAYHVRRFGEALAAYDRAVQLAFQESALDRAWELALVAANVSAEFEHPLAACARYRALACWKPDHPQAAEVHLLSLRKAGEVLALWTTSVQIRREDAAQGSPLTTEVRQAECDSGSPLNISPSLPILPTSPQEAVQLCMQLSREHLSRWPNSATADTVRVLLARLLFGEGRATEAVEVLARLEVASSAFPTAVEEVSRWCHRWFSGQYAGPQETLRRVEELCLRWLGSTPGKLPPAQRAAWVEAGLLASRLCLLEDPPNTEKAESALAQLLSVEDPLPEHTLPQIQGLALLVYAMAGRVEESAAVAREMAEQSPAVVVVILEELWQYLDKRSVVPNDATLRSFLRAIGELRRFNLDPELAHKLARLWLRGAVAGGTCAEALGEARTLVGIAPRDPEITELAARILLCEAFRKLENRSDESVSAIIREARALWRQVEADGPPLREPWFQAKAALALLAFAAGDRPQAEKIVRLVELFDPSGQGLRHPAVERLVRPLPANARQAFDQLVPR